jgi:hypothetical protein
MMEPAIQHTIMDAMKSEINVDQLKRDLKTSVNKYYL